MPAQRASKKQAETSPAAPINRAGSDRPWPADAVERWPIERLTPYARNARTHSDAQVAQIAASIREWGWTTPVLVDEQGGLIAGHGRVLAARQLGIQDVPVMVARGWTEAQRRAYVLADNKLALNAGWDPELFKLELADLQADGFDLGLAGFQPAELDIILIGHGPEGAGEEAEAPEDFGSYGEDIDTEHQCPSCGYRWSGKSKAGGGGDAAGGDE